MVFELAFATSVCFAQSSSQTAISSERKQRQYLEVINQLFYYIQQQYVEEVAPEKLYEGALKGMLESLDDPYSVYMDKADWRSISDTTVGNFGGVGLQITKPAASTPEKPAYVEVAQPIEGSPGEKAGIQAGDLIIKINDVDTDTISMEEVLNMLRGTVGESVDVTIRRGRKLEFTRTLVRAVIENPTVKFGMIEDTHTGYIKLSSFSTNTARHVQEAIDSFKEKHYDSLIVDIRNNGGGLLASAVDIANKFIDEGPIVSTKSRISYENTVYKASADKTTVKGIPVIVLINGASASASEILSGALKDTKVAYLVGEKTYGKGSVQIPRGLVNEDGFKITVARYYSPSDTNIDKIGIVPDREVKFPEFTTEEDEAFVALMESSKINEYVEAHEGMTEKDIADYAVVLAKDYALSERVLRKLIRNEVYRTRPAMLYDLDYDVQLTEALKIFEEEDFEKLLETSKTLKELQAEVMAQKEETAQEK